MKKHLSFAVLFMALISCKKTQEVIKPETLSAVITKPPITFTEPYYRLDYEGAGSMLVKQTSGLNTATYAVSDTGRKYVSLIVVVSTVTDRVISIVEPVLPTGVDRKYSTCMAEAIRFCNQIIICGQGTCKAGLWISCLAMFSLDCLFSKEIRIVKYPKITKVYLGPINP